MTQLLTINPSKHSLLRRQNQCRNWRSVNTIQQQVENCLIANRLTIKKQASRSPHQSDNWDNNKETLTNSTPASGKPTGKKCKYHKIYRAQRYQDNLHEETKILRAKAPSYARKLSPKSLPQPHQFTTESEGKNKFSNEIKPHLLACPTTPHIILVSQVK